MSSLQFPPSSPVLDGPELSGNPFKGREPPRGRFEYPTPNPSSTVGRLSSPARQEKYADPAEPATVSINRDFDVVAPHARDFDVVAPHARVLRVPLLSDRSRISIGRSSKSCDFHFKGSGKATDKRISRCHVTIEYPGKHMVLTCTGFNGFGIIVPRVCLVKQLGEKTFQLVETDTPLRADGVWKSIHLDHQHTEFHVARGESVHMPRFANVLLQVGSHVLLVNPDDCDEDVTDDEPMELEPARPKSGAAALQKTGNPHTPRKPAQHSITAEEPTPSRPRKCLAEQENLFVRSDSSSQVLTPPLSSRSPNVCSAVPAKRRAHSEEPQGPAKKAKRAQEHDANGKLIIDEQCLAGVGNVGEIENIIINHLAFSRLSSTPASFLNTILAVVSKLTLQQLRVVLHQVDCIGVIYRLGKDAAGKPLEEEYYYIPEKDRDPERNKLVSSVRGHGGLRACRKTHKQYYWKKPAPIKK
ncbi:hypothetical protein METBIDRAFT_34588 [Metschnikowia bicuspidata var. bicuspidata NRRL YB-4993]|uniref:FHA domain-containing protein n=1 Tax=Metschnikowia bicuspidata var. bicuspidata NRRL YB-4993 TaxID=869754 RepID=A0A1A0HGH8_9ASCO|nr:hypothetical protein METBIDRAFT_34588 [Metschnikowia bicuspidata var. bicuspidata NRRL YB-4993]OBA22958.1 hypothetical protein METBIDRAFT_34588 [Metschnikowia bicuspidata var. bicuspidata NRRL YB-4993]